MEHNDGNRIPCACSTLIFVYFRSDCSSTNAPHFLQPSKCRASSLQSVYKRAARFFTRVQDVPLLEFSICSLVPFDTVAALSSQTRHRVASSALPPRSPAFLSLSRAALRFASHNTSRSSRLPASRIAPGVHCSLFLSLMLAPRRPLPARRKRLLCALLSHLARTRAASLLSRRATCACYVTTPLLCAASCSFSSTTARHAWLLRSLLSTALIIF